MYHLLLCDEFTAVRAKEIGLVQEVVPAGQQIDRAMAIAATIARNAPLGIQVTKEAAVKYVESGERRPSRTSRPFARASSTRGRARGHPLFCRAPGRGVQGR